MTVNLRWSSSLWVACMHMYTSTSVHSNEFLSLIPATQPQHIVWEHPPKRAMPACRMAGTTIIYTSPDRNDRWHVRGYIATYTHSSLEHFEQETKNVSHNTLLAVTELSTSSVHDYTCIYYKPDWLLQQFDEWTTRESHQETPACAKHSCQTSFQSEEIWSHNSCTRYASLASSQIPDWIQNTIDRLQRTSWQGTYLHPRNDHPIKKQKIFHKIQWRTCPEGPKIQAWYFRQACIRSIWASGMELFAKGN